MIRSVKVLFCDNEHGVGDITFPRIDELSEEMFIYPRTTAQLRKEAKKAGWKHIRGNDYCNDCVEGCL
jgi:hypothetical protein